MNASHLKRKKQNADYQKKQGQEKNLRKYVVKTRTYVKKEIILARFSGTPERRTGSSIVIENHC